MKLIKSFITAAILIGISASIPVFAHGTKGAMKSIPRTSITFDAGSALLTEADKSSLRKLVRDAGSKGIISQVTVAAWSDKALPTQGQKLLDIDRTLAADRADVIETFLKTEMNIADVDTYNMAENTNWLARTFNTRDAELKSVFGRTGAEVPVTKDEFHVIRQEGGPFTAVAVVELKPMRIPPATIPDTSVIP